MVRYVALRHFAGSKVALRAAFTDLDQRQSSLSELITPLVEREAQAGLAVEAQALRWIGQIVEAQGAAAELARTASVYVKAMSEARFIEAYDTWSGWSEVADCLEQLPEPNPSSASTRSIAVVLPGSSAGPFGREIDEHDLVARTGTKAPDPRQWGQIGSRFDIAFLNLDRYRSLVAGEGVPPAERIVTKPGGATGPELDRVEFGLSDPSLPTSGYTYLPLVAVPWCFRQGLRPILYNADFYLGSELYQDAAYDRKALLAGAADIIHSYLRHDVFFAHAAMRHWLSAGYLEAQGDLADILVWDGREFAAALERKWRDVLGS